MDYDVLQQLTNQATLPAGLPVDEYLTRCGFKARKFMEEAARAINPGSVLPTVAGSHTTVVTDAVTRLESNSGW